MHDLIFREHLYATIFVAASLEGIGLPIPAELIFLLAVPSIETGTASLWGVVLVAAAGNMAGALTGFGLAWWGGWRLLRPLGRLVGARPGARQQVERFIQRYGVAAIFLARFVGLLRAPAIYAAGAGRMAPLRFAAYFLGAALLWNGAWAWLALQAGRLMPERLLRLVGQLAIWGLAALLIAGGVRMLLVWMGRRAPVDS